MKIEGYTLKEYSIRTENHRGGVAIYLRKKLTSIIRADLQFHKDGHYESAFIELVTGVNQKNIIIGEIYRIPGTNEKLFLLALDTLLQKMNDENKELIIGTDQNIDFLKINDNNNASDLLDIILRNKVFPVITRPTRITHSSATLIDNIHISTNLSKNYTSGIILCDISDHCACLLMLTLTKRINKEPLQIKTRKMNQRKINNIQQSLQLIDWSDLEQLDTELAYDKFENILQETLNWHAPEKTIKITQNVVNEPWMTKGLKNSAKRIYKMYSKCIKKPKGDPLYDSYKQQRNKLNSLKRKAKITYYHDSIINYKNDSKKLWKIINSITGKCKNKQDCIYYLTVDGIKIYNKEDISNKFCNFFSNIGKNNSSSATTPNKVFWEFLNQKYEKSLYFYPTDRYEIEKIISSLKNKPSFGSDKISNVILKAIKYEISTPLEIIFNKSMLEGKFPTKFKLAHVIPIYKNKDRHELNNYRPISLLSCTSKILERIIFKRLNNFLEVHGLFSKLQFGFRKQMSTIDAITYFLTELIPSLDKKDYSMGIFIDLSKAFDMIDHKILLHKLEQLGVRGITKSWFNDYLSNRMLQVRIPKENTNDFVLYKPENISIGVPQGSILGPILFLIYIHDMENSISNGIPICFADDTTLFLHNKSFEDLYINAYENLKSLIEYLDANKLAINLNKTKYILFVQKFKKLGRLDRIPKLIMKDTEIKKVDNIKFLGIHMDSKLSWQYQVNNTVNKLKQAKYIFKCCKAYLPNHSKKLFYNAHVVSHIMYGSILWAPMINNTQRNKIDKCLKHILVQINNNKRINNMDKFCKEFKILKLDDMIELELCKFMYKIKHRTLPEKLLNSFEIQPRPYNTRNAYTPQISQHSSTLYNQSFLTKSNIHFIRLPEKIKNANNMNLFKKYFIKFKLEGY